MATLVKKAGNTRKPYTVRYVDPKTSKQREQSFARQAEARAFKAQFDHGTQVTGAWVDPKDGRADFVAYALRWIDGLDRAENTKREYRSVVNARLAEPLAGRSIASVAQDRDGIWELITTMPVGASRKSSALTVIMGTVKAAKAAGKIGSHNLDGLSIEQAAAQPAEIIPATKAQLATLRSELKPAQRLLIDLMVGCGLRIAEALAVRLDGFMSEGRVLRIGAQILHDGKVSVLKHRKAGESRDVPVPSWVWEAVKAHAETYGTDDGYLFCSAPGVRLRYENVRYRFAAGARKGRPDDGQGRQDQGHGTAPIAASLRIDSA